MPRRMNLVGDVYGRYTVIAYSHTSATNGMSHYICKCSCGTEKVVSHGNLRSGHTQSCGCLPNKPNLQHGLSSGKTFKSWCKIKERCFNPNDISYKNYGAKGITLADEFIGDFMAFYEEVGESPTNSRDWSIERIDNKLGYVKGNMKWAHVEQQARNKRKKVTNTSGVTGVQFYHSGKENHTTYAVATWYSLGSSGKFESKKFSVRKNGLLPAFKLACEYRLKMIEELNAQGAGYTSNHGK